jgi:hypothetical protein
VKIVDDRGIESLKIVNLEDREMNVNETVAASRRNPMTADTDPTDEELAIVMREACELAMRRKAQSDEWSRQQLAEAVRAARERPRAKA